MRGENDEDLSIREIAERAGVTPRTVRYYVSEGLLPPPEGAGPHRIYTREHLLRLEAIKRLKTAYLPLDEIRRRLAGVALADLEALTAAAPAVGLDCVSTVKLPAPVDPSAYAAARAQLSRPEARSEVAVPPGASSTTEPRRGIADPAVGATWVRIALAPGVELHYRPTTDPERAATIFWLARLASSRLAEGSEGSDGRRPIGFRSAEDHEENERLAGAREEFDEERHQR